MKRIVSLLVAVTAFLFTVAAAEIRLDYDLMTEEELLQMVEEVAAKLENYGYSVAVQKVDDSQVNDTESKGESGEINQEGNIADEYPISINYIRVTNQKGLSSKKDCTVSFKNTCEKEMRRVYFTGTCYNRVDEYCGRVSMSCTGPFNNGDGYSIFYQADVWNDNAASRVVLTEVRIVFMDNSEIIIDKPDDIERLFVRKE